MRRFKGKWFTTVGLWRAYNRVRMAKGEEWKTAFCARFGHFEYMVMPFRLTRGRASFQDFIKDILGEYLDSFCTTYIDDILIYLKTIDEHHLHVPQVLQSLEKAGHYLKPEKCKFHVQTIKYLRLLISANGISMDLAKVATVKSWAAPESVKGVQNFLGFVNFY